MVSFQRVTLESSLYYAATYLKLSFLDPSSQATRMTLSWMETSVSYFHDTMTTVIPLLVSAAAV
ncbi:MAG: hypothetical protein O7167_01075 [Wolbachia endosymbiont of Andrena nigroaenea]|nr:hypothetical protein [Wolbachia endosymbiont of Andrena nigroaenea]